MEPWWYQYSDGDSVSVVLVQFDLTGHSAWSSAHEESGQLRDAYEGRRELRNTVKSAVLGYGLEEHHWAGDGGLFVGKCVNSRDADNAYQAMCQMYHAFRNWGGEGQELQRVGCRISATVIPNVCVDQDPGNWYSTELNRFLKYERDIGHPGAMCITNDMRKMLDRYRDRFCGRSSRINTPDGQSMDIYDDKDHPWQHETSKAKRVLVRAHLEHGVDTGMSVRAGQKFRVSASGTVSFDQRHYSTPDGILCTVDGLAVPSETSERTYVERKNTLLQGSKCPQLVGALVGWIGDFEDGKVFLVGSKVERTAEDEGILHLAVNDVRGTYGDNRARDGSELWFAADVEVI